MSHNIMSKQQQQQLVDYKVLNNKNIITLGRGGAATSWRRPDDMKLWTNWSNQSRAFAPYLTETGSDVEEMTCRTTRRK